MYCINHTSIRPYLCSVSVFFLFILTSMQGLAKSEYTEIHYPNSQSQYDIRVKYPLELLALALSKSSSPYKLIKSDEATTQSRALKLLHDEGGLDVVWTMTNLEREKDFLPVRIPILKGLIGWRVLIIKEQNQPLFDNINNLKQLKKLVAGQGLDWPDTDILKSNGLAVETSTNYDRLFEMLQKGRFEYFPRSITEVWLELSQRPEQQLAAEKKLLLYYPTAMYYFVKKDNNKLANDIQQGLEEAIEDGSFDTLFYTYNQVLIDKSKLSERTIITLTNPQLSKDTPLDNTALWFSLPREQIPDTPLNQGLGYLH
ncbi:MAG: transporter substrate-binding domain-containing protein [Paraglaciecola sp.]|nr:transporter substrate-binding domain-containing protein [Paraglaciecola sp.]